MSTTKIRTFLDCVRRTARAADLEGQTDRQLLECFARSQDEAAFTCLVRRHGALVLGVCWRVLRHREDTEDAFQATFLALAGCAARTHWREGVSGWLHDVAYRVAAKAKVSRARRRNHEERGGIMRRVKGTPVPGAAELTVVLDEELSRLSEPYRTLLVQCYLEGKGHDQVARELGYSPATFKRRLQRGRELLRLRLARRGVALSTALLIAGLAEGVAEAGGLASLVGSTVRAAALFAVGQGVVAGSVPSSAAALAQGVLQTLSPTKTKILLMVVLTLALTAVGGALTRHVLEASAGERKAEEQAQATDRPDAAKVEQIRRDRHGDPLPRGALARLGTVRWRHDWPALSLAFTSDGKRLLTAGGNNLPRLWDVATGKPLREFTNIPKPQFLDEKWYLVFGAQLSPDGRLLATRSGPTCNLYLLETATGKRLHEFKCQQGYAGNRLALNFAFSPDSKSIAAQLDGRLELRDTAAGRTLWQENEADIVDLAFAPDGTILASASYNDGVRLWNARTGEPLRALDPKKRINRIAFSPDGRILAIDYEADKDRQHFRVHLWDVAAGKEVRHLGDPEESTGQPAFSPDGKIVATSSPRAICLWDAATGKELHRCPNTCFPWSSLAFSPDGKLLAAMDGPLVRFWDVASGQALPPRSSGGHESRVNSVAFTPDGQTLISVGGDFTVRWWDTRTGQQRQNLPSMQFPLRHSGDRPKAVLSPDGTILATLCVDILEKDLPLAEIGKASRGRIRLWDAATGKELRCLDEGNGWGNQLVFTPDGKTLAEAFSAADGPSGIVRLWDVASGKRRPREFPGLHCAFSPDGNILVTADGTVVRFWDVATGKHVHSINRDKSIWSLFLSSDGSTLAIGSDLAITLFPLSWDKSSEVHVGVPRRIPYSPPRGDNASALPWAFSPDGRMLASSDTNHAIHLWETASGKERACFPGHHLAAGGESSAIITSLSFSADGRWLASGSADSTILLWDVTNQLQGETRGPAPLSAKAMAKLWADLASDDAGQASRALWALAAAPSQAVPYLEERLQTSTADAKAQRAKIPKFLRDLDDDAFLVRDKARTELSRMGGVAEPALRQALKKPASAEVQRRLEELLAAVAAQRQYPSGKVLRDLRAVEVLEQIGTPEARRILKTLAKRAPEPSLMREASVALERLERGDRHSTGQATP